MDLGSRLFRQSMVSLAHNGLVCKREMNGQARTGLLHTVRVTSGHTQKHDICSFCLVNITVKKFGCGTTPIVSGQRLTFWPW